MGKAVSALESQRRALRLACEAVKEANRIAEKQGWRLVEAYLVGSRARGDYTIESDIDIVLVVKGVDHLNVLERLDAFRGILKPGVEIRVYTPLEWSRDSVWMRELRKEARPLLKACETLERRELNHNTLY